ncbi:MAG: TIGR01212 family radical SAM protein [bacterium]|jgi:radical SAM protein (TIGR01212 family)|nr:TIGR01212 family radical SAM protein [bacterium]
MMDKPYYPFGVYLKERFGSRVHKVAIDAGFTCPNINGTKGNGGCVFCNNEGFSYNSRIALRPITDQIEKGIEFMRGRFKATKFMAYFQAHTNTFAPTPQLKTLFDQVVPYDEIVALSVGTRPDSISLKTLDLLESYSDRFEVWVEYGLQSVHNRTLQRINRCDTYERFLWAIDETSKRNLKICVHVILGLPGESQEDMMNTAEKLQPLPFHSIKVHLIHVMKNTPLEKDYVEGTFTLPTMEEYVQTCADFVERIHPDISIQRLTADAPLSVLVAPLWCQERQKIIQSIEEELIRRGTRQGSRVPANIRQDLSWKKEANRHAAFPQIIQLA